MSRTLAVTTAATMAVMSVAVPVAVAMPPVATAAEIQINS